MSLMCQHEGGTLRPCSLSESAESKRAAAAEKMENSSADDVARVKLLCSFGGSILPRPSDGKLRYVGGETRIVCLPHDIEFAGLMVKMRELFDTVSSVKYQQPDEDLDALVSVVNDDDVVNMIEEYDKLGSVDGCTRLRVFLFSPQENESSCYESVGGETDQRYLEALNSMRDSSNYSSRQSDIVDQVDNFHHSEQFINPTQFDSARNFDVGIGVPHYGAHHIGVPHIRYSNPAVGFQEHEIGVQVLPQLRPLGRISAPQEVHSLSHTPRYNEMEMPWSPAHYLSGQQVVQDPRSMSDFCSSPSSRHYRIPVSDLHEKVYEESNLVLPINGFGVMSNQAAYDYPQHYVDGVAWVQLTPSMVDDPTGNQVPVNPHQTIYEGNGLCQKCLSPQRGQGSSGNQYPDAQWKHIQGHYEQPNYGSDTNQFCGSCHPLKESHMHNEVPPHETGWVMQHINHWPQGIQTHATAAGRPAEQYAPLQPGTFPDQSLPLNMIHNNALHFAPADDGRTRYMNIPTQIVKDNNVQSSVVYALQSSGQGVTSGNPAYEVPSCFVQSSGVNPGNFRATQVGSPRFSHDCLDDEGFKVRQSGTTQIINSCDPLAPDFVSNALSGHISEQNLVILQNDANVIQASSTTNYSSGPLEVGTAPVHGDGSLHQNHESRSSGCFTEISYQPQDALLDSFVPECSSNLKTCLETNLQVGSLIDIDPPNAAIQSVMESNLADIHVQNTYGKEYSNAENLQPVENSTYLVLERKDTNTESQVPDQSLSLLPDLIASVKKAALEGDRVVHESVNGCEKDANGSSHASGAALKQAIPIESSNHEFEHVDEDGQEDPKCSNIEQTSAEEEAITKGLQTINNEDLEEIRELGSGTYGSVYHGKWRGSDVAIKRIKASCFAGRPSERERLIVEFWKEASILSSLHHPNIVSFYGVVRDGADGTLATVTEFMVNGSLKQVLQKKDRTIDRRKRLIIAMDASFGMEYLHGKKIVHFDLKCENLLVNMKDPHRPICKIGDLGLSKVRQKTLVTGGIRGTLPWMAPELLNAKNNMVTEKIDVYSFGIVMWELLTGEEPYADMHCASIIGGIVNNTLRPQIPSWCDPEWRSLMESCWSPNPGERPSFSEISQTLRKMFSALNAK